MGWDMSNILVNLATSGGGVDPERVTALEGDVETLEGDVETLETDVGTLKAVAYRLIDVTEKELTGTSYEDMTEITLEAGVYHLIASATNTVNNVAITGIRFADGSTGLVESVVNGLVKSVDMIYAVSSQTTIKVQTKGSANCKNVKTWVMVAKVGDITPPTQNTRKGGKK